MISLLLALAAVQQTSEAIVPLGVYRIHPVVGPFIRPYTGCIEAHVRAHVAQPASTDVLRLAYDDGVAACADVRRAQYRRAERALARSRQVADASERRRILDETFRMADQSRNLYGDAVRREMRERQEGREPPAEPKVADDAGAAEARPPC